MWVSNSTAKTLWSKEDCAACLYNVFWRANSTRVYHLPSFSNRLCYAPPSCLFWFALTQNWMGEEVELVPDCLTSNWPGGGEGWSQAKKRVLHINCLQISRDVLFTQGVGKENCKKIIMILPDNVCIFPSLRGWGTPDIPIFRSLISKVFPVWSEQSMSV